jgi:Antitoxin to bacterial toxin RNase LS or RnlA
MKNYHIQEVNLNEYKYIVFSCSYVNPTEELNQIEQELHGYCGKVLFDLLLSNGFNSNRYVEAIYNGKEFVSFKVIENIDPQIKEISGHFYRSHLEYLDNSVLSNAQKFLIKRRKIS